MGMRSYGYIPIWDNQIDSSSNWVWGFQDNLFTLFAIISTGGILFGVPMEPWFVTTCAMYLWLGDDKYIGGWSGDFYDLHLFSVAQSTGAFTKSFYNQNWIALPEDLTLDEIMLHTWRWYFSSSGPDSCKVSCIWIWVNSLFHQSLDILKVPSHPHFEMLFRVADIDLVRQFTGNYVNDDRHSAVISMLILLPNPLPPLQLQLQFLTLKSKDLTPSDKNFERSPASISLMFGKRW
jgi:hypothetical protein